MSAASLPRPSTPAAASGALVIVFIGVTAWWLSQDSQVPDYDSGLHLKNAFGYYASIAGGKPFEPLTAYSGYAPFAELIGSIGRFVGGPHIASAVIAENLVFVPMLALGCYQVGKLVAGSVAGALAVIFALGSPMIVGEFHEFFLDPPLAALVAVTVWLLLASERFDRLGYCVAAGAVAGLGMLTKQSFAAYVAGVIFVVLARGGWRNWRGILVFATGLAVVAGPWYAIHFQDVQDSEEAVKATATAEGRNPAKTSFENLSWYVWALTNRVLLLPLGLAALAGTIIAAVRVWRDRYGPLPRNARDSRQSQRVAGLERDPAAEARGERPHGRGGLFLPELLGGLIFSWFALTFVLQFKDNRYILPILIYAAVLGTFWIVSLPIVWRRAATAAVAVVAALNFCLISFGIGEATEVDLPGFSLRPESHPSPDQGKVRLLTSNGWLTSGPEEGGKIPSIIEGQVDSGVRVIGFEAGGPSFFNQNGLAAVAAMNDVPSVMGANNVPPNGLYIFTRAPQGRFARPCVTTAEGTPVFFARGGQKGPVSEWKLICPKPAG